MSQEKESHLKTKKESRSMDGIHFYILTFETAKMTVSQMLNDETMLHLTDSQLDHCFESIIDKLAEDQSTKLTLIHLKKNRIIATLLDRTKDFLLGPNTLRTTFVFPGKIMLPSAIVLKQGPVTCSLMGKKMRIDNVDVIAMAQLVYQVREISEQDALTVFEGAPHTCVKGMI